MYQQRAQNYIMTNCGYHTQPMSTVIVLTKALDEHLPSLTPSCHCWLKIIRMFLFKEVCGLPSLYLVSLLRYLVHGEASIRKDVVVFHGNSLGFSGQIPIIYMNNNNKK